MKVGVLFPSRFEDPGEFLADGRAMEAAGVDSVWMEDDGGHDPMLALAAIAAVIGQLCLGLILPNSSSAFETVSWRGFETLQHLSRKRGMVGVSQGGKIIRGSEEWLRVDVPEDREAWARTLEQAQTEFDGVIVPMDPRCSTSCGTPMTRSTAPTCSWRRANGRRVTGGVPSDIKVLAFDVFGTVVDWRSGVMTELAAIAAEHDLAIDAGALADAWRKRYQPFLDRVRLGETPWQVLDDLHRAALREVVDEFSLHWLSESDLDRLVLAWHKLPPWPDAVGGLTRLGSRFVLTTLSNGGVALLVDLVRTGSLLFDCILSAELVKTYKPDPSVYRLVPDLLAVRPEQAMMVAAHPYDLAAAAREGMRTAFVRRPQELGIAKKQIPDFPVDILAEDFLDLAAQLGT